MSLQYPHSQDAECRHLKKEAERTRRRRRGRRVVMICDDNNNNIIIEREEVKKKEAAAAKQKEKATDNAQKKDETQQQRKRSNEKVQVEFSDIVRKIESGRMGGSKRAILSETLRREFQMAKESRRRSRSRRM